MISGRYYYRGSITEFNGEFEYSHQYLIRAKSEEEALEHLRKWCRTYYFDEDVVFDPEEDRFDFFDGTISIYVNGVYPTTTWEFIREILADHILL